MPYYSVIGGWVLKYLVEYVRGHAQPVAEDGYFSAFISDGFSTEIQDKCDFPKEANAPTGLFFVMRPNDVSAMIIV